MPLSLVLVAQEGKEIQRSFKHIPSSIGAFEAEEVGVEHLIRDVNDPSVSSLANQVGTNRDIFAGAGLLLLPPRFLAT